VYRLSKIGDFAKKCIKQHLISIENRIRRFSQNKTDLREIIQERVKSIELANNKRPIRKFNESNPFEMLR
jgi:IS30 family transposase